MKITELEGYELAGRFKLKRLMGKGGYGAVFEAEQLSMGRTCAVKVLVPHLTSDPATVKRFKREARSTSRLAHPNTIVIYDFGLDEDVNLLFLAMEFLQGSTLNDLIAEHGPMEVEKAVHILEQAASSLDDAAQAGIVHRDIKPHNIMITRRGNDDHYVKVIDFGIAKALGGADPNRMTKTELTVTGTIVGTPQYMSPEQIRDEELDGRTDQYSLAICVYKMLTGQTPFTGSSAIDIATRHLTHQALPLSSFDCKEPVSEAFEAVLFKALAKDRNERFDTSSDFAAALRHAWEQGGPAAETPTAKQAERAQAEESAAPSGSFDAAPTSHSFEAPPTTGPHSDAATELVDAEEWLANTPGDAPVAPSVSGAVSPEFEAAPQAREKVRERDGVRVEGMLPRLDMPDSPGFTARLDPATDPPTDTAAIPASKAQKKDSDRPLPWLPIAGIVVLVLGLVAFAIMQMGPEEPTGAEVKLAKNEATPPTGDESNAEFVFAESENDAGASPTEPKAADEQVEKDVKEGTKTPDPVKKADKERADESEKDEKPDDEKVAEKDEPKKAEKEPEEKVRYGKVTVTLMPWGELWVGRRNYGDKERQTLRLKAGRHRLRLRQNGETKASKTVDVEPGGSTMVLLKAK